MPLSAALCRGFAARQGLHLQATLADISVVAKFTHLVTSRPFVIAWHLLCDYLYNVGWAEVEAVKMFKGLKWFAGLRCATGGLFADELMMRTVPEIRL